MWLYMSFGFIYFLSLFLSFLFLPPFPLSCSGLQSRLNNLPLYTICTQAAKLAARVSPDVIKNGWVTTQTGFLQEIDIYWNQASSNTQAVRLAGCQPSRREEETSRWDLPALTQGRLGRMGPGEAAVIHLENSPWDFSLDTKNQGFLHSWIPTSWGEVRVVASGLTICQLLSDPLVAFFQQNKMLNPLWSLDL